METKDKQHLHLQHYPSIFNGHKKKDIFSLDPLPPTGIQKSSHIAKRISYSNQKPPIQKTGFHIAGTNIINDALQSTTNKVILMSRNVFAASNNTAFNTSDGLQDVKVFDDDDYLLNEEATEHKYLHRHH
jgi:hypothetical protein